VSVISLLEEVRSAAKHRYLFVVFVKHYVLVCASFMPRKDAIAVAFAAFAATPSTVPITRREK